MITTVSRRLDAQVAFALVDHRLDGENHAGLQDDALSFPCRSAELAGLRGNRVRCRNTKFFCTTGDLRFRQLVGRRSRCRLRSRRV